MKVATKTLGRSALIYAVALAEGWEFTAPAREPSGIRSMTGKFEGRSYTQVFYPQVEGGCAIVNLPAYLGDLADNIIDREMISTQVFDALSTEARLWNAYLPGQIPYTQDEEINGPDRRTAAMRAWCVFKLGEEVEIPDELLEDAK